MKVDKNSEELKTKLTKEQYYVCVEKGTEQAFTGKYLHSKEKGAYNCVVCGNVLFMSDAKFDSGTGWPSFFDIATQGSVKLQEDLSLGMRRIEVVCSNCGSHLGHVFDDGPQEKTGKRYCINSAALGFKST